MGTFIQSIFSWVGLKRRLAALLSMVIELANTVPELQPLVMPLTYVAAFFGVTGVAHGAIASTLGIQTLSTIAAALVTLLAVARNVPALVPYVPLIQSISAIVSALAIASKVQKDKTKDEIFGGINARAEGIIGNVSLGPVPPTTRP